MARKVSRMAQIMQRKNIRLPSYNYQSNGYYFVTICTAALAPLLLNFRKRAEELLLALPDKIPGVCVDYYKVMPTHIHVIFVLNNSVLPLNEIVRRYKAYITKETQKKPFWEWNYYEHIIRDERALYNIRGYIESNAEKHRIDLYEVDGSCRINPTATKI